MIDQVTLTFSNAYPLCLGYKELKKALSGPSRA